METRPLAIRVSPEAARMYESASEEENRKLDALISLKLRRFSQAKRPLEAIMSDLSRKAQERGLTPDILDIMLDDQ
jgi:hypothetical protein